MRKKLLTSVDELIIGNNINDLTSQEIADLKRLASEVDASSTEESNKLNQLNNGQSKTRKTLFKRINLDDYEMSTIEQKLTDKERQEIDHAIENNFLKLLKRIYAITARSRYGK